MNPLMRPAGILIPSGEGPRRFQAGFNQIEACAVAPGTAAESTCVAKPLQNITLVVKGVDDYIASGQLRAGEQPVSLAQSAQLGTLLVTLEPLLEDSLEGMTPGSSCIVNAYTSFHEELKNPELGAFQRFGMHAVDAIALVHDIILRLQALFIPIQTLVLKGH